jgi:hypothetical protein
MRAGYGHPALVGYGCMRAGYGHPALVQYEARRLEVGGWLTTGRERCLACAWGCASEGGVIGRTRAHVRSRAAPPHALKVVQSSQL